MKTFREFCDGVVREMPRATGREKEDVRWELTDHLLEHRDMLVEHGYDELEAERRAIAAMGDPVEIGRAWNEKLSPFWLWLGRICLVLFVLILWDRAPSIWFKVDQAVNSLEVRYSADAGTVFREMKGCDLLWSEDPEIEEQFGEHIIRVYRVELWQDRILDEYYALKIYYVSYHQDILGTPLNMNVWNMIQYDGGENKGGGSSGGPYAIWTNDEVQVKPGQEKVFMSLDYNGNYFESAIELEWGGEAA